MAEGSVNPEEGNPGVVSNPLKNLYESLGGSKVESVFTSTPEFKQGFDDYHLLLKHREDIGSTGGKNPKKTWPNNDLHPGQYYTQGINLRNRGEVTMRVPGDNTEEYATSVGEFVPAVSDLLKQGKSIRFGITALSNKFLKHQSPWNVSTLSPEHKRKFVTEEDLAETRRHMIGFGKAALDEGDVKVALLSFEAAGILDNPQVTKAVEEIVRDGGTEVKEAFRKTMQVIEEKRSQKPPMQPYSEK